MSAQLTLRIKKVVTIWDSISHLLLASKATGPRNLQLDTRAAEHPRAPALHRMERAAPLEQARPPIHHRPRAARHRPLTHKRSEPDRRSLEVRRQQLIANESGDEGRAQIASPGPFPSELVQILCGLCPLNRESKKNRGLLRSNSQGEIANRTGDILGTN